MGTHDVKAAPGSASVVPSPVDANQPPCSESTQGCVDEVFSIGRWVKLHGMQTTALNDCLGEILSTENSAGRLAVRVTGHSGSAKLVKRVNLKPFAENDVVKIARIGAQG